MKTIALFLSIMLIFFNRANAATIPSRTPTHEFGTTILSPEMAGYVSKMKIKEVERLLGRKLRFKEKIAFKILQWKTKKEVENSNKGKTALIFSLIALGSLLIPVVGGLGFILFTVLALILGYQAKKEDPSDKNAKNAIIIGWINVGLFLLALLIVIAVLSAIATWGWG